ncbi:MAG: hypothetical protein R2780_08020 [Crocinitomicaceae bacterium]
MKRALLLLVLNSSSQAWCCDVCQKNQPRILQNITHGTGPQSNYDYIIIWSAIVIVFITLVLSLKYLIKPKEKNRDHVKHIILENQ